MKGRKKYIKPMTKPKKKSKCYCYDGMMCRYCCEKKKRKMTNSQLKALLKAEMPKKDNTPDNNLTPIGINYKNGRNKAIEQMEEAIERLFK